MLVHAWYTQILYARMGQLDAVVLSRHGNESDECTDCFAS